MPLFSILQPNPKPKLQGHFLSNAPLLFLIYVLVSIASSFSIFISIKILSVWVWWWLLLIEAGLGFVVTEMGLCEWDLCVF